MTFTVGNLSLLHNSKWSLLRISLDPGANNRDSSPNTILRGEPAEPFYIYFWSHLGLGGAVRAISEGHVSFQLTNPPHAHTRWSEFLLPVFYSPTLILPPFKMMIERWKLLSSSQNTAALWQFGFCVIEVRISVSEASFLLFTMMVIAACHSVAWITVLLLLLLFVRAL